MTERSESHHEVVGKREKESEPWRGGTRSADPFSSPKVSAGHECLTTNSRLEYARKSRPASPPHRDGLYPINTRVKHCFWVRKLVSPVIQAVPSLISLFANNDRAQRYLPGSDALLSNTPRIAESHGLPAKDLPKLWIEIRCLFPAPVLTRYINRRTSLEAFIRS